MHTSVLERTRNFFRIPNGSIFVSMDLQPNQYRAMVETGGQGRAKTAKGSGPKEERSSVGRKEVPRVA